MKKFSSPTKQKALLLLAAGVTLGLSRSPRTHLQIWKTLPRAWRAIDRAYLYRIIREFRQERLVNYLERKNGSIEIVLSEEGRKRVLVYRIDEIAIAKPTQWNGHWHMVIFDIPEKKRRVRDALRLKLRELGFHEWQKSVFVHPYLCRDEIDFIVEFFDVRPYVRYAELLHPTNEAELKLHFNLS